MAGRSYKLIGNVAIDGVWYGPAWPDSEVTDEVARRIDNPGAWEGGVAPFAAGSTPDAIGEDEPPRDGRGSGVEAWREHAESLGIVVPDGAKRDEVIALVDAFHGRPPADPAS